MFRWFQKQWRELKKAAPGCRFQELHNRRHAKRKGVFRRRISLGIAIAVVIAGIVMMPLPGPGWPIVLLGAGLLARESSRAARAMDSLEVRIRGLINWGLCHWQQAPFALRFVVVVSAIAILGAGAWGLTSLTSLPERVRGWLTNDSTHARHSRVCDNRSFKSE